MPQNFSVDMSDPDFIKSMIAQGSWERYEHPQKGETLTLLAGKVAVISIHEILLGAGLPATRFMEMMKDNDQHLAYFLLAENAQLRKQITTLLELLDDMKAQYVDLLDRPEG